MDVNSLLFLVIVYFASVVSTLVGFGSALITLPFASLVVDIKKAIGVIAVYYLAMNVGKTLSFRKHIDWRVSKLIVLGSIPGGFLGASALYYSPPGVLKKILGLLVLMYVLNRFVKFFREPNVGERGLVFTGVVYGFFSGLVGTGSAIKAPVLLSYGLRKESFAGTHGVTGLVLNAIKIGLYLASGILTFEDFPFGLILVVVGVLGLQTGKYFLHKVSPRLFERLVIVMLSLASIKLLIG